MVVYHSYELRFMCGFNRLSYAIWGIQLLSVFLHQICVVSSAHPEPWKLPILPAEFARLPDEDFNGKLIPRHLWLTFRNAPNSSDEVKPHLQKLFNRHIEQNWTIHLWDDQLMLEFLETKFQNTSLLWAYKIIHPKLGVSRSDIWRYAVLWYYGGVYMDDDSFIDSPFDNIIGPTDRLIVSVEKNVYRDGCYHSLYKYSLDKMKKTHPEKSDTKYFGARILINWMFMAEPGNVVLSKAMEIIVELVRLEYFSKSPLRTSHSTPKWMKVMCTTGPSLLTTAALSVVYAYNGSETDFIANKGHIDWRLYGGVYKMDFDVPREKYYMYFMQHEEVPMLSSYDENSQYNQAVITANNYEFFFVAKNIRWPIASWDVFIGLGFSKKMARVVPIEVLGRIPKTPKKLTLDDKEWVQAYMDTPRFLNPE